MRNISKTALLMLLLSKVSLSFAATKSYPAPVPVTGETSDTAGSASGVAWPNPRFVVGRGATANCITDKLTGLMWVKDLSTVVIKGGAKGSSSTWQNALDSVKDANFNQGYCGYKDWRLPTVTELKSLVNYSQNSPASWLNSQGFGDVQASLYWSSTTYAPNDDLAWYVNFGLGGVDTDDKDLYNYVLPVRGGK